MTIDQYLEKVARFAGDQYGSLIRQRFADAQGQSELAMLQVPTDTELIELKRAVAIMTPREKTNVAGLSDEQVQRIADDARVDPANLAIFINGY
ncbi:MAG: hypothetical protein GY809_10390, partial [Planctomycetes bacterium]|nr:hypothetical protein [Planctomycetota bacterium]